MEPRHIDGKAYEIGDKRVLRVDTSEQNNGIYTVVGVGAWCDVDRISSKLRWISEDEGKLVFWCAGCKALHRVWVKPDGKRPTWTWNQDGENPTFHPSVLLDGYHEYTDDEMKLIEAGIHQNAEPYRCHSIITNGMIRYLNDCSHGLAGQTIVLPDIPETGVGLGFPMQ